MDYRLRTPKRYKPGKRGRRVFRSYKWLRNLLLIPALLYAGYLIYYNQSSFRAAMFNLGEQVSDAAENAIPPTATPVIDVSNERIEAERTYRLGNYSAAIDNYQVVIQGAPNDILAHYRLAYLLIITSDLGANQEHLDEALSVAKRAINADPEAAEGWAVYAMALVWQDRNAEAISYASRALEIQPDFVMAQAFIAQAYWQSNLPELAEAEITEAVNFLREAGSASPETIAQIFRTQGLIYEGLLERETAIEAYERAREAAPHATFVAAELALSYWGNGQEEIAIEVLSESLTQNPRDTTLLFFISRIYTNLGNASDATQALERCVQINPNDFRCLSWLGGYRFYAQQYTEAIDLLQRAIDGGSNDPADWWQLGRSYYWIGQCEVAIPLFRQGYSISVEQENAEQQGRIVEALRDCNATIEQ
ncbi:MAG: tetratricopeptide repeat protein [Anaerolineae bacterium]|nr:tetratricopeptide repeat protein [Anaerolineae bacterium]